MKSGEKKTCFDLSEGSFGSEPGSARSDARGGDDLGGHLGTSPWQREDSQGENEEVGCCEKATPDYCLCFFFLEK